VWGTGFEPQMNTDETQIWIYDLRAEAERRPRVGWTHLDWVGLPAGFTIYEPNLGLAIRFTSQSVGDGCFRE